MDFFGIEDPNFRGGARIAFADINADGVQDLIVAAGFGGGPRVAVWNGAQLATGNTNGATAKLTPDFFAFESTLRNGVFITGGDLDGDGFDDVIAGAGPGGGPRVFALSGQALLAGRFEQLANFFAGDPDNRGGIAVAAKKLNGDGFIDLITAAGANANPLVSSYDGASIPVSGIPQEVWAPFQAFPDGFSGGVFVG